MDNSHDSNEPVAWMYQCSADSSGPVLAQHKKDWAESGSGLWTETPLYTSPQPVHQQEPWVGLTTEDKAEIEKIVGITEDDDGWMVSQMFTLTEAKLREKNNG